MKESSFRFSRPELVKLTYELHDDFQKSHTPDRQETVRISVTPSIERNGTEKHALVSLEVSVGEKSSSCPFYIVAIERAVFHWEDSGYSEEDVENLLTQNAPSLLLSYLRPVIATVTNFSCFSGFNLPFMDLRKN